MDDPITEFRGQYSFLSNFYHSQFKYQHKIWPTAEHAFQANKTLFDYDYERIRKADNPKEAKRIGRSIRLRDDWDQIKLAVMKNILLAKFSNSELREKLLATGDRELVEGNWWGDCFWGMCNGRGENHLGRLLMEVRQVIQGAGSGRQIADGDSQDADYK